MSSIRIIHGENEDVMESLYAGGERFALAYLDPPFASQRDYKTASGELAFSDKWRNLETYLNELEHRLTLARDLLIDEGSLVLHLDCSAVHEAKLICDKVFGRVCFASEIIWRYRRWPAKTRNFQRMHDVLLRYVRDPNVECRFNQLCEPLANSTLEQWGTGKQRAVHNTAGRRVRSIATEEAALVPLSDVWEISIIAPSSDERTVYPTQKPEELIWRLVESLTNVGDSVLDPYCGSGSVPAVCAKRDRGCVSIDSSPVAIRMANERLAPLLAQGSLFARSQ